MSGQGNASRWHDAAHLLVETIEAHPLIIVDEFVFRLVLQEGSEWLQVRLIGHNYAEHLDAGIYVNDLLSRLLQHTAACCVRTCTQLAALPRLPPQQDAQSLSQSDRQDHDMYFKTSHRKEQHKEWTKRCALSQSGVSIVKHNFFSRYPL